MKTSIHVAALAALFAAAGAGAQQAQPDSTVSYNVAAASDYRYRGISQTRFQPALQGGADYVDNKRGLYAGTWLSTIRWTKDAGGGGDIEWDLYAGKRGTLDKDIGYDVGVLSYVYPANGLGDVPGLANANTTELYGQLGYGPAYIKYSHALTNLFGFQDSKHSGYTDLGANVDAGNGITVNLHLGHQSVRHISAASYTDWKIGATKDFGVASVALAWIGTDASESAYASPANGKFLGRNTVQLIVTKTF